MVKQKEKLAPIPKYRPKTSARVKRCKAPSSVPADAPSLGHIAPQLRAFAVPVESIDFYPGNPHKHDEGQLKMLRASLREFGQMTPLTVNTAKSPPQVVKGNGTLQAALAEDWKYIAVHGQEMSDQKAAAYVVADNRAADLSPGWDANELKTALDTAQVREQDLGDVLTALAEAEGLIPKGEEESAKDLVKEEVKLLTCPHCGKEFEPEERSGA